MTVTGLRRVAERIEDLDRAVRFYEEVLGGRLIARFDPSGGEEWMAFFRGPEGNLVGLSSRRQ